MVPSIDAVFPLCIDTDSLCMDKVARYIEFFITGSLSEPIAKVLKNCSVSGPKPCKVSMAIGVKV